MGKANVPATHNDVMPYIIVKNANDFSKFMQNVFGAEETFNTPGNGQPIMHAEARIGKSMIMFADCNDKWPAHNAGLFVYVDDADKVFAKAIENGATVVKEISDQEYGRSGGVKDPFGNIWWITAWQGK